ncbi:PROTEIN DEFECTIVE IN MERISTEM SILENCING 3 [Salix purpurea]|uniref:PROTEIN DEFECTIVE IN MERISTEM SILENCING 3 n=1 Tax=Salix purpurea TaxID=77065 RepID=A0A9Q0ZW58_SALPP|nr:PROTEIN DEFECTIVE IN MERISTEM SILENCING 3 [Salix purpurea]
MQVAPKETSMFVRDEIQNGVFPQAQSIIYNAKKLQDDLHVFGMKIKHHEDNIKFLKSHKYKLDDSILDLQVILGKYHSSTLPNTENDAHSSNPSEEETTEQILLHEKSAAGILCQLKMHHDTQTSHLSLTKDVLGVVATLGKVDDDNLSRLFSEYLGVETMLAIVCKTYEGVKALETYDKDGQINKGSGFHALGDSVGKELDGRYLVICLENIRPYCGEFMVDDPQRRLDLLKPKLPNGECPPGFLGFAVNMINVEFTNLFFLTGSGHGLRETLFYNLFSRVQVYKTREDMVFSLPCIRDGAISLDGGMIKGAGVFSLGNRRVHSFLAFKRNDVDVRFPKSSVTSTLPDNYFDTEKHLKEMKWKREKMLEDIKREKALLDSSKQSFERKKEEFVKFLAHSSAYAAQAGFTPR